jgi:hypothetical protein
VTHPASFNPPGQEDAADLKAMTSRLQDDAERAPVIDTAIRHKPCGHESVIARNGDLPAPVRDTDEQQASTQTVKLVITKIAAIRRGAALFLNQGY